MVSGRSGDPAAAYGFMAPPLQRKTEMCKSFLSSSRNPLPVTKKKAKKAVKKPQKKPKGTGSNYGILINEK
jgi:hypothetical protein